MYMEFNDKKSLNDFADLNNLKNIELIHNVSNAVDRHKMLDTGDSVLVSVSGGPDSVFLLYFLNIIKKRYSLNLFAFHLDHLTRMGDSTKDAGFVKNLCLKLNIPLFSEEINVKNWCLERKLSFQEGARNLRKELLEKYRLKNSIRKIAIAHNADDNIETFLMNLIRGTGLKGLGSIKPVNGMIIRPLIYCHKDEIMGFLTLNNFNFCIDRTNSEDSYFRNKIRNKLVPYIENELGRGFKKNILNTINILRSSNEYIESKVFEIIAEIQKNQKIDIINTAEKGFVKIPISVIENLDDSLKTFFVYKLTELVKGSSKDIISTNVTDILKYCFVGGESKQLNLSGGIIFMKEGEFIYIYNRSIINYKDLFLDTKQGLYEAIKTEIGKNELGTLLNSLEQKAKGTNVSEKLSANDFKEEIIKKINNSNYRLKIKVINAADFDRKQIIKSGANEAFLDLNKIKFPVLIRKWRYGDKFMPFGMNNYKKLQDFFTDAGVPLHSRSMVTVFCDAEKIIWLGGLRIDERVKVDNDTKSITHLILEKIS
jgi:tRNA(Ile)-lysidine synthase